MNNNSKTNLQNVLGVIAGSVLATLVFGLGMLISLIAFAQSIQGRTNDNGPDKSGGIFATGFIIVLIISSFIGGFVTGKISNGKPVLYGLFTGILLSVALAIINKANLGLGSVLYYAAVIAVSAMGAALAGRNKKVVT